MKHILIITFFGLLTSCIKIKEIPVKPNFDVTVSNHTYKAGEAVIFTMTGDPDFITFFSGEQGKKYDNTNRVRVSGTPHLQFTSARTNGSQPNSLQLLVATDFAGVGADSTATINNLAKAQWVDITDRAEWSTGAATPSGAIDLSDFAKEDQPVFIAFKYNGSTGSIQNKWTITALTVTNTLPDGSVYTIANLSEAAINNYGVATVFSPGWVGYKVKNDFNWVIKAGTSLVITGASTAATATADAEAWTFSGALYLNRVAPDVGVPLKGTDTRLTDPEYSHTFTKPGTYEVVFLASNTSSFGQEEVVKRIQLTIEP